MLIALAQVLNLSLRSALAVGNALTGAAVVSPSVWFDSLPPVVAAVKRADAQAALTATGAIVFNVSFSSPVTGVAAGLFSLAGSTASVGSLVVTPQGSLVYAVACVATGTSFHCSTPACSSGVLLLCQRRAL